MKPAKLSSKHQIVVPRDVREKMNLRAGENVYIYVVDENRAVIVKQPEDHVSALEGLGQEVWSSLGGGDQYIREERSSWDRK